MEIGQQGRHLLIVEATGKARHQSPAVEDIEANGCIGCGNAAGQRLVIENAVKIWRYFLEGEIVVFMAMGTANLVEILPCRLLW